MQAQYVSVLESFPCDFSEIKPTLGQIISVGALLKGLMLLSRSDCALAHVPACTHICRGTILRDFLLSEHHADASVQYATCEGSE